MFKVMEVFHVFNDPLNGENCDEINHARKDAEGNEQHEGERAEFYIAVRGILESRGDLLSILEVEVHEEPSHVSKVVLNEGAVFRQRRVEPLARRIKIESLGKFSHVFRLHAAKKLVFKSQPEESEKFGYRLTKMDVFIAECLAIFFVARDIANQLICIEREKRIEIVKV